MFTFVDFRGRRRVKSPTDDGTRGLLGSVPREFRPAKDFFFSKLRSICGEGRSCSGLLRAGAKSKARKGYWFRMGEKAATERSSRRIEEIGGAARDQAGGKQRCIPKQRVFVSKANLAKARGEPDRPLTATLNRRAKKLTSSWGVEPGRGGFKEITRWLRRYSTVGSTVHDAEVRLARDVYRQAELKGNMRVMCAMDERSGYRLRKWAVHRLRFLRQDRVVKAVKPVLASVRQDLSQNRRWIGPSFQTNVDQLERHRRAVAEQAAKEKEELGRGRLYWDRKLGKDRE